MGRSGGNAGQFSLHLVAVDAKENVYTGGVAGKRIQEFRLPPMP
jgi:hypothetical protein